MYLFRIQHTFYLCKSSLDRSHIFAFLRSRIPRRSVHILQRFRSVMCHRLSESYASPACAFSEPSSSLSSWYLFKVLQSHTRFNFLFCLLASALLNLHLCVQKPHWIRVLSVSSLGVFTQLPFSLLPFFSLSISLSLLFLPGVCLSCQGNTRGPSCAECKPNFYRERGSSPSKSCLPCPCSSVTSSGNCTLGESLLELLTLAEHSVNLAC